MAKYPIGIQDFATIIREGYQYVDKTGYIPTVLQSGKFLFLSRPRRFGKSLFLSTLEYFFKGERELFKNLAIDAFEWSWEKYPVIHLDLNGADYTREGELYNRLDANLAFYEGEYKVSLINSSINERFRNLIYETYIKTGKQIVILVDEYEKPVIDNLDFPKLLEKHKEFLRGFYSILKSMDKYIKLGFLSGITKFGQMNVFSGLNNIRDISLNPQFDSICGVTETELIRDFQVGINEIAIKKRITENEVVRLLKENYDGYHFSESMVDTYNPYSLINAFADGKLNSYWAHTGTPAALVKILQHKKYNLEKLEGIKVDEKKLLGIDNKLDDPVSLLYQTGYLTIKDYNPEEETYTLGYPNREVENAFFEYLLPNYAGRDSFDSDSFINEFRESLELGNPIKAIEILEEFSAGLSYDIIPKSEIERHFQSIVYIICRLLVSRKNFVKVEEKTCDGRIDLLIATTKFIYIIEIKRDKTAAEALRQIKEKEYGIQFRHDSRRLFMIGINFSTSKQRIDGFEIFQIESSEK